MFQTLAIGTLFVTAFGHDDALSRLEARKANPEAFTNELVKSEFAAIAPTLKSTGAVSSKAGGDSLPLVFLHGMGDSCFNRGMESITEEAGDYKGVYSVCIPTGDTRGQDTMNGFFMSMNENVDVFAEKVKADPKLAQGFNCVGLSQGNNICRGYIQRYNNPPVSTHLSIHGPVVGVSAFPSCYPDGKAGSLCQDVSDVLANMAYNQKMQDFLFQADYFRDVNFVDTDNYKKYSEMAAWNNEGESVDEQIKANFAKTSKFAMIKANADSVVVPREGEWWGAYDSDYTTVLTMKETNWYKEDTFGLRTADEAGKIFFNSTEGNHLDFSTEQLYGWLDLYC
jgi:palmitoyl-protein thioesterase